ncbi:clathrin heavy chain linker domain-containing protein 1-like [Corticium candelabrum]|uniref:clathrin heavy chain linker domain-containing protein 1-like n=1 Tax=Corticium candelabrum TaxID=121492 RepID=UPI002E266A87|nr:clathrin heavy chain linker domain-containing protein 1-like [Corticium candelabrum]
MACERSSVSLPLITRSHSDILLEDCSDIEYSQLLEQFLNNEIQKTKDHQSEERFAIHKACMGKLIERLPGYRLLLTAIQSEYESFSEALQRGETEGLYLESKLINLKGEKGTLRNYKDRIADLCHKLKLIEIDNTRIEEQILDFKRKREEEKAERLKLALETGAVRHKMTSKQRCLLLRHLTLEQSTNIDTLRNELAVLEASVQEMQMSSNKQFLPRAHKEKLEEDLKSREKVYEKVGETHEDLKSRLHNLKAALLATTSYCNSTVETRSLADVVELALAGRNYKMPQVSTRTSIIPAPSSLDEDLAKERETQKMLDYMDKFNELMTDRRYEKAAVHAANSPKGTLRTSETLQQFKAVSHTNTSGSPLLFYCETLMATIEPHNDKPNISDSLECAQCILQHGKLDLLAQWLAADSLTCSVPLGRAIENSINEVAQRRLCFSLAQTVYTRCAAHREAALSMCRQGRPFGAMRYAQEVANFQQEDFQFLLETVRTSELALTLIHTCPPVLSLDSILTALQQDQDNLVAFYKELACHPNLHQLVCTDSQTSQERWLEIVHQCQELDLQTQSEAIMLIVSAKQS